MKVRIPVPARGGRGVACTAALLLVFGGISLSAGATSAVASGYELVSPPGGDDYDVGTPLSSAAPMASGARVSTADGENVAFGLILGTLPGMALDGNALDAVVASRTGAGWTWRSPLGDRTDCPKTVPPNFQDLSASGSDVLLSIQCAREKRRFAGVSTAGDVLDQTPDGLFTSYRVNLAADQPTFLLPKLGTDGAAVRDDAFGNGDVVVGASPDQTTVYIASIVGILPGMSDSDLGYPYVYKVTPSTIELETRDVNGDPFVMLPGSDFPTVSLDRTNAISEDGSAFTLTANRAMVETDTSGVNNVYQVRDGAVTWISDPAAVPPDNRPASQAPADRVFEGASADGESVFFSTSEQLTADDTDASPDLYLYDRRQPADRRISRVSVKNDDACTGCDDNADSSDGSTSSVAKFSTPSADGSHVFFVSGDVLSGDDDDGQQSLYVRDLRNAETLYIAPAGAGANDASDGLDAGITPAAGPSSLVGPSVGGFVAANRPIRASATGTAAAFSLATDVDLATGRGGNDADGTRDLYVWSQQAGLRRVRQGVGADANTTVVPTLGCLRPDDSEARATPCRAISADGSRVFTQTTDSLAEADTDGARSDVYAVDTTDGSVELVSPAGTEPYDATYVDSSATGDSVFFRTRETVDPSRDTDRGRIDLYVARSGDVLPPVQAPVTCLDDACQGGGAAPPLFPETGSLTAAGPGNVVEPPRAPEKIKLTVSAPKGAARGSTARLRVTLAEAGRVRATGAGLRATQKTVKKPGAYQVPVRLSPHGKLTLRRKHRLRIAVTVRFTPRTGAPQSVRRSVSFTAGTSKNKEGR